MTRTSGKTYNPISKHCSKVFTVLQFLMTIIVMVVHTTTSPAEYTDPANMAIRFLDVTISAYARPVLVIFFMLSGYFLTITLGDFSVSNYIRVLRKKTRTLLVPYLLWLILPVAVMLLIEPKWLELKSYGFQEIFWNIGYFKHKSWLFYTFEEWGYPAGNLSLWFLRDLLVLMLAYPLLLWIVKRSGLRLFAVLLAGFFLHIGLPGLGVTAPYSFVCGIALAVYNIDFIAICRRLAVWFLPLYFGFGGILACMMSDLTGLSMAMAPKFNLALNLTKFFGAVCMIGFADWLVENEETGKRMAVVAMGYIMLLAPSHFFLYVSHNACFMPRLESLTDYLIPNPVYHRPVSWFTYNILRFILLPAIFFTMRRYMPRVLGILTGNHMHARNKKEPAETADKPLITSLE